MANSPKKGRSQRTNQPGIIAGIDGRSTEARRRRDLIGSLITALGGPDRITDPIMSDIVRAADLTQLAENARTAALRGSTDVTVGDIVRLEGARDRAVRRLNLASGAEALKPTVPSLADYIAAKQAQKVAEAAAGDREEFLRHTEDISMLCVDVPDEALVVALDVLRDGLFAELSGLMNTDAAVLLAQRTLLELSTMPDAERRKIEARVIAGEHLSASDICRAKAALPISRTRSKALAEAA